MPIIASMWISKKTPILPDKQTLLCIEFLHVPVHINMAIARWSCCHLHLVTHNITAFAKCFVAFLLFVEDRGGSTLDDDRIGAP